MKRSWFGFFLLLGMLAVSLGVTWGMDTIHRPVCAHLEAAAEAAAAGDWDGAGLLSDTAGRHWDQWAHFRLCFADHNPVEAIEENFAQLGAYLAEKETADFTALCRQLSRQVDAVSQAHGLTLWNLF